MTDETIEKIIESNMPSDYNYNLVCFNPEWGGTVEIKKGNKLIVRHNVNCIPDAFAFITTYFQTLQS